MHNNIKKILMTIPMILAISFCFLGTNVHATEKSDKQSTLSLVESENNINDKSTEKITKEATKETTKKSDLNKVSKDSSDSKYNNEFSDSDKLDVSDGEKSTNSNENDIKVDGGKLQEENDKEPIKPHFEKIDGKLHYVTEDGILEETGWFKEEKKDSDIDSDNEYYLDDNYIVVTGWTKIENDWYYFDENGVKQTGWKFINYEWYHLNKDGIMEKGWIEDDGHKYYLNDSGQMSLDKKYIDNNWYFFGTTGVLQTEFYSYKGKEYYSDKDGVMVANKWITTKSNKYYVKADSSLAVGDTIIDGILEKFDKNGRYEGSGTLKDFLFVKYLNVGNADCAFIKLPSEETVLIDTGDVSTSEAVVNFIKEQDLKNKKGKPVIDYVIITHAHSDHIGGLSAILDNFNVNKVYMPENAVMKDWYSDLKVNKEVKAEDIELLKLDYKVYKDAVKAMKDKKIKFTNTVKGEYIDKNNLLQFVQSDKDFGGIGSQKHLAKYWGINENSAIVYLNYGDFQSLFTGDMEWNSEKDLWVNDLLDKKEVDILKVPHHGLDTSSTSDFINYVNPCIGVISRSEKNISDNTAYKNLITNGVSIYETSSSKNGGISVYATEENWSLSDF